MRLYHRSPAIATIRRHGFYSPEPVVFTDNPTAGSPESWPTLVFDVEDETVARFESVRLPQSCRMFTVPAQISNTFLPIIASSGLRVDASSAASELSAAAAPRGVVHKREPDELNYQHGERLDDETHHSPYLLFLAGDETVAPAPLAGAYETLTSRLCEPSSNSECAKDSHRRSR
jgi:hypothetical protein